MNFDNAAISNLPPVAAHLFNLGATFASRDHHRSAALAFASAARASGVTRYHQAVALFRAAQHLVVSVQTTRDDQIQAEDRTRALGYLQKCKILARDLPPALLFTCTMQALALIEQLSTYVNDHLGAAKTINTALDAVSSGAHDPAAQLRWWCYFRGRAVANALASGNSVEQAALVAVENAGVCERSGDLLSAAAFHLVQAQIALGASVAGVKSLLADVSRALGCLDRLHTVPAGRNMDYLLLRFGAHVLQCLSFIRVGDLRSLRENLGLLSKSYNRFRVGRKQQQQQHHHHHQQHQQAVSQDVEDKSWWNWWPHHYLSAITYYIMTAVSRSNCDMHNALIHAMTALSRLGIPEQRLTSFTLADIAAPGVSPRATLALTVALLENAARIRLTQVELDEASVVIGAAVDLTFRDVESRMYIRLAESETLSPDVSLSHMILCGHEEVGIIPRCTAFLLLSEYHNLRGRISAARVATQFLDAIRATAGTGPESVLTDTWQMVVSYLSLLTGDDRSVLASSGESGVNATSPNDGNNNSNNMNSNGGGDIMDFGRNFISAQVHALAWFTNGVYHMRKTDVLESRKALSNCLHIVNQSPLGNDQLIANASAVLSGLVITRESISQEGVDMAVTAVELSNNLGDIVATVRATRQHKKVLNRVSQSMEQRQQGDAVAAHAFNYFIERTKTIGPIFTQES